VGELFSGSGFVSPRFKASPGQLRCFCAIVAALLGAVSVYVVAAAVLPAAVYAAAVLVFAFLLWLAGFCLMQWRRSSVWLVTGVGCLLIMDGCALARYRTEALSAVGWLSRGVVPSVVLALFISGTIVLGLYLLGASQETRSV
jgi:hypothetical protein